MRSSRSRPMRLSTPWDSTAGLAGGPLETGVAPVPADSIPCSRAISASTFRNPGADDEREHKCKHGKPFHDRCRCHRDAEDRRLVLAGSDGGSATLALQDNDENQSHSNQNPDREQLHYVYRHHGPLEREPDNDAVDGNRGRQNRQPNAAPLPPLAFHQPPAPPL